jgi:outer membrane protein
MIRIQISAIILAACLVAQAPAGETLTLSVEAARQMVRDNSPAIRASAEAVTVANATRREAHSGRMPTLTTQAGYSRLSEVPPLTVLGNSFGDKIVNQYTARATVAAPLFTGFRLENAEKAAGSLGKAAASDRAATESDVIRAVEQAYWSLHGARTAESTMRESVKLVEVLVNDGIRMRDAGVATKNDVLKLQLRLSEVRLAMIQAQHRARVAEALLANVLSVPAGTSVELTDALPAVAVTVPDAASLEANALAKRPELTALKGRMDASERAVEIERGARYPSVQAVANYTVANPNLRYQPAETKWNDTWDVGLVMSWTAWDGNTRKHRTSRARAEFRRLKEMDRRMRNAISLEVMRQRLAVVESARRIAVAGEAVSQAGEHFRITNASFKAGASTSTEVLDAETALKTARMNLILARVDQQIARAGLRRAVGDTP